ncbi:hypothetical protein Y032_0563g3524 [Ancylostoma ceylanicum]|uniref:Uncharacterized protein n=1 Tax=Ancylostoma ceylanicum TaxID=53326 RepID=A0A016WPM6_9BILA|nr:hypothetical protein Y032_0563g3524 [Ancylostoma ceylanicum]
MYLCRGCKKVGKTTSIFVTGEDFTQDPETIGPTLCQYEERESDKANRMLYESYWYRVVDKIERMSWGGEIILTVLVDVPRCSDAEKRNRVVQYFVKRGYDARRSAYSR